MLTPGEINTRSPDSQVSEPANFYVNRREKPISQRGAVFHFNDEGF